ncbi:MAG TPA: cytochrome c [Pyrinomonadaceae bacterium]|jgi:mono/diheme cytochrome c family protein
MKRLGQIGALCAAGLLWAYGWAHAAQTKGAGADAATLFAKHCATCHGKDGRAKTMKSKLRYHARDLTDAAWQSEVSDERLFNSISAGRGKMPAFGKKLPKEQIDALVAHVRGLKK